MLFSGEAFLTIDDEPRRYLVAAVLRPANAATAVVAQGLLRRLIPTALVHDSALTDSGPNPEANHRPRRYDSGRPSSVTRFRMLHASTASVARSPGERARRRLPLIDVSRKQACSTRASRWSPDACFHRRRPIFVIFLIVRSRALDRGLRRDTRAVLCGGTTTVVPRAVAVA